MNSLSMPSIRRLLFALATATLAALPTAKAQAAHMPGEPNLDLPTMDPHAGRRLFASKGCVLCHSINGIGGTDAPRLDASTMPKNMNPFDLAARMWRGAPAMIAMQYDEIGSQIQFNGQELANIIAFIHDPAEQAAFSEADIPPAIKARMDSDEDSDTAAGHMGMMKDGKMPQGMMNGSGGMMGTKSKN